jgi:predicted metal-binding membrane protein
LQNYIKKLRGIDAWKHGLRLGIFCVGSCWSLMLLVFALGHDRLDLMLALSGIMAAERLAPWGRRLSLLVGFALMVLATFWVLASPHSGHSHP